MKKLVVVLCGLFLSTFAIAQEEHGGTPVPTSGEEHGGKPVGEEPPLAEPAPEAVGQQKAEEHAGHPVGKEQAIKKGKGKKKGLYKKYKPQRHPKAHQRGRSKRR